MANMYSCRLCVKNLPYLSPFNLYELDSSSLELCGNMATNIAPALKNGQEKDVLRQRKKKNELNCNENVGEKDIVLNSKKKPDDNSQIEAGTYWLTRIVLIRYLLPRIYLL